MTPTVSVGSVTTEIVVDASFWVSANFRRDSNYLPALAWSRNHLLNGGTFVAPSLLVTETAAAIAKLTRRPQRGHQAAMRLYATREMRLVPVDQKLIDEATTLSADLMLRGADAYYVALAKMLSLPITPSDVR